MASLPALVIVPGSFSYSTEYEPVVGPLRQKGYDIHVLDPPCYPASYKKGTPGPLMYDDAKFIHVYVAKLADEGKDVVLLGHSYGGMPTSESLNGLTKPERQQQQPSKQHGVVRVAYMAAIVPKTGQTLGQAMGAFEGQGALPPITLDEDGWMTQPDHEATAKVAFSGISAELGTAAAARFGKHSAASFATPLTHDGYKNLPVSWFFTEEDVCVAPVVQQAGIDAIEESWKGTSREGKKVHVTRVKCDHVPVLSATEETVKWIESLIVQGGQEE